MDRFTENALNKEWAEEARIRHMEYAENREGVKLDFLAALKEREAELKNDLREIQKNKSLRQRIAEATGNSHSKQAAELQLVRDARRVLTRESLKNTSRENMTFSSAIKEDNRREVSRQRGGYSDYFEGRREYVAAQAQARLRNGQLQPATNDHRIEMSPEQLAQLKSDRLERVKAFVSQVTSVEVQGNTFVSNHGSSAVENALSREITARRAEDVKATNEFRGRESVAESNPQVVVQREPEKSVSLESIQAAAAITMRAEIFKEAVEEVGYQAAADGVSKEDSKAWVQADERDLKSIDNEFHAADAVEAIQSTMRDVPEYRAEADNAQLDVKAQTALYDNRDVAAEQAAQLEAERVRISERHAHAIESSFRDMRAEGNVMHVHELPPHDIDAMAVKNVADLVQISQQEIANEPAETIAYNMNGSEQYAQTVERMLRQFEQEGSPNTEVARHALDRGRNYVDAQNVAAEAAEARLAAEAEQDPFGAPVEAPAPATAAVAAEVEQDPFGAPVEAPAPATAAVAAEVEQDPFGAPVEAPAPATAAVAAEVEQDPFGAFEDGPLPVMEVEEIMNSVEPVTVREAANDEKGPLEAANEASMGREEIVLDAQTMAHLARARAADRQAAEQQLGHDEQQPAPHTPVMQEPDKTVNRSARDNQVESDEILTASQETRKPIVPPEVEKQYVNVGNKYYNQKSPEVVAFEDKGNRLETRSNNEEVAANLVKIAEARGWDEIKVTGSETFRKEVWMEAAARGMNVKGYNPSEADKASLAARTRSRDANTVEPAKTQEQKTKTVEQQRAESFKNDSRDVALKKHPELAGAYAAQAAASKKMDADNLTPKQREFVQARVSQKLVNSIENGRIPEVNRREEVTAKREMAEEREQSR